MEPLPRCRAPLSAGGVGLTTTEDRVILRGRFSEVASSLSLLAMGKRHREGSEVTSGSQVVA
jgi:hypothetical protein